METASVRVRDIQPSGSQFPAKPLSDQQAAWGLQQDAGLSLALELSRHIVSESELRDLLRAAIGSIRRLVSSDAAIPGVLRCRTNPRNRTLLVEHHPLE
jgi:hypothetical protein